MEHLDSLLKLVDSEFEAIEKNGKFRSRDEIDSVYKLVDIVKDINEIHCYEDEMYDDEYSGAMMPMNRDYMGRDGRSYRGGSYNDGGSYARGRRNTRRDSMGRYSRNSYRGGMDGYSRADKHEYIESLRDLADNAPDEQTRQSVKRMIEQMEQG